MACRLNAMHIMQRKFPVDHLAAVINIIVAQKEQSETTTVSLLKECGILAKRLNEAHLSEALLLF